MSRAWLREREPPSVPKDGYAGPAEHLMNDSFKLL
jgi:hypothetical protein